MFGEGHMMNGDWGTGWMWLGGLGMVLFWALVIVGIVALVRGISGRSGAGEASPPTALEILEGRYARGEIDRDEYEQKRRDLGG